MPDHSKGQYLCSLNLIQSSRQSTMFVKCSNNLCKDRRIVLMNQVFTYFILMRITRYTVSSFADMYSTVLTNSTFINSNFFFRWRSIVNLIQRCCIYVSFWFRSGNMSSTTVTSSTHTVQLTPQQQQQLTEQLLHLKQQQQLQQEFLFRQYQEQQEYLRQQQQRELHQHLERKPPQTRIIPGSSYDTKSEGDICKKVCVEFSLHYQIWVPWLYNHIAGQ